MPLAERKEQSEDIDVDCEPNSQICLHGKQPGAMSVFVIINDHVSRARRIPAVELTMLTSSHLIFATSQWFCISVICGCSNAVQQKATKPTPRVNYCSCIWGWRRGSRVVMLAARTCSGVGWLLADLAGLQPKWVCSTCLSSSSRPAPACARGGGSSTRTQAHLCQEAFSSLHLHYTFLHLLGQRASLARPDS